MDTKLIKSAFSDDPEVLTLLKNKEQNDILKEVLKVNLQSLTRQSSFEEKTTLLKGDKGDKGDSPSEEELKSIIIPLIPEPIKAEDGKTPTRKQLISLIKPLIPSPVKGDKGDPATPIHKTEVIKEELTITKQLVKEIIQIMHSLPEADKLEVSKGIRNFQSFIFNGTKYKTEELMHGGNSNAAIAGISIVAVSGTIDDSNVTFTAVSEPTLLNINGAFYQKTGGVITWSFLSGTITLSSAIGTGGSIFGIT